MRTIALSLLLACHGGVAHDDAIVPGEPPPIDAPELLPCTPQPGTKMSFRRIGQVATSGATLATSPPGDGRLFVVEQQGRIRIFDHEQLRDAPFLDIRNRVLASGERGLLGLAFHPRYATNNYFYVFYTTGSANVLSRFSASATDPYAADPASETILLSIPDFAANHNGGMIEFGADGYLYIGTGDGGGGGDPHRNGQAIDRTAASCIATQCEPLLGKILRIDVDHPANGKPYGIPQDNPFAAGGGEPEIFVIGLRNPWRWSFDRATGDLWIADVGQSWAEELDVLPAGQQAGVNLGWSMWEGTLCFVNYTCTMMGMTFPKAEWVRIAPTNSPWAAIIGGQVYRGSCYPDLQGYYFFSEYATHPLARAQYDPSSNTVTTTELPGGGAPYGPSSLHADARGELYLTSTNGNIYHLEAGL